MRIEPILMCLFGPASPFNCHLVIISNQPTDRSFDSFNSLSTRGNEKEKNVVKQKQKDLHPIRFIDLHVFVVNFRFENKFKRKQYQSHDSRNCCNQASDFASLISRENN